MKSYFFVPANRLHKIPEIKALNVDEIIIDLEDSIKVSKISQYLTKLTSEPKYRNFYIRLNILNEDFEIDLTNFNLLAQNGFTRFILPKFQNASQLRKFFSIINKNDFQFIILVENPKFFIQLDSILEEFSQQIYGVGIGSHDLLSLVGAKHTMNNLEFVRQTLLYTSLAYDKEVIDFASMNINEENDFLFELTDAFDKGFNSKFFIHPWQIECLNKVEFYSMEDYNWAKSIYKELQKLNFNYHEFNAIKIGDQIVEKPHVNRAISIIEYFNKQ
jgi:citrate lyase beta subunit